MVLCCTRELDVREAFPARLAHRGLPSSGEIVLSLQSGCGEVTLSRSSLSHPKNLHIMTQRGPYTTVKRSKPL